MTIEFLTPYGTIRKELVSYLRDEIIELSHQRKISRAEVVLKEDAWLVPAERKVCEITLMIPGGDMLVHGRSGSFERSAREVTKELKEIFRQEGLGQTKFPGVTTGTEKVY